MSNFNQRRAARALKPEPGLGRDLPHSVEAEECLLGCCLIDGGESIAQCQRSGVTAAAFFAPANQIIFERLVALNDGPGGVDAAMLAEDLRADGRLGTVGGVAYLAQITAATPTTLRVKFYIERVLGLQARREKAMAALRMVEAAMEGEGNALIEAEAHLHEVGKLTRGVLPPVLRYSEFLGKEPSALPAELVEGTLHKGAKMMIAGGSKSFKTWVLLDLCLSVATGMPWWGMRTHAGRVLYVNMEIARAFCEQRVRVISEAKGIKGADNFDSWHLRGYARDFTELMPQMLQAMAGVQYDLICLDPVYKILGERDENANGEVAALLNEFEALSVRSGAAIVYGHHHSKGNQSEKDARDRSSGAGAWTRDPDTLVDLTPHEEDEHFTATYTLRNHPPRNPMVVRWKYPCMLTAPGMDPSALRKPGRPVKHEVGDLLAMMEGKPPFGYSELERAAVKKGISKGSFGRLLADAIERGSVEKTGNHYRLRA